MAFLRQYFILFLFLLIPIHTAQAAELRFSKLDKSDGLSQGTVNALAQDKYGFIWIGTEDGLARYDGNVLKLFRNDPDNPDTVQDNVITALAYDANNRMWVGSEADGVSYYDYKSDQFIRIESTLVGKNIKHIFANNQSGATIIHSDRGLFRIDSANEIVELLQQDQAIGVLYAYENEEHIQVVFRSGNSVSISILDYTTKENRLTNNRIRRAWSLSSCKTLFLTSLESDSKTSNLYCNNGLQTKESPINTLLIDANLRSSDIAIIDITEQEDGTLWLASNIGLIKIQNNIVTLSKHLSYDDLSISSNKLTKLLIGKNTLFIGTEYDGLNMHQTDVPELAYFNLLNSSTQWNNGPSPDTKNESCGPAPSVDYDTVWSILKDSDGDLWVGNDYGMAVQKAGANTFTDFSRIGDADNFFDFCAVWALAEADGQLWIGLWGGLVAFNKSNNTFTHYKPDSNSKEMDEQTLSGRFVRLLLHDKSRNSLWIGTNANGLNRLDLSTREIIKYPFSPNDSSQLPHGRIRSLHLGPENQLWVGSGGGLSLWDEQSNTFRTQTASSASTDLSDEDIRAINHYSGDLYWIGTGNGINLFNAKTFQVETRLNEKDGLANSTVYAMVADDSGLYWITTANGLSKFDPTTLNFQNYTDQDGLQSNEFNFNAWHKGTDGTIFVGGVNGLNVINPLITKQNDNSYPPVLTEITATNSVDEVLTVSRFPEKNQEHDIPSSFRNLSFNYATPSFSTKSTLFSQHDLSRNAGAWSALSSESRQAIYTNVLKGRHFFRVRSGENNDSLTQQTIYIKPYLWERVWFRLLAAIVAAILILLLFLYFHKKRIEASLENLMRQHYYVMEHELSPHLHQANANLSLLASSPTTTKKDKDYLDASVLPLMGKSLRFLSGIKHMVEFDSALTQPKYEYMLEDSVDEVLTYFDAQIEQLDISKIDDINIHTHQDALYLLLTNLISNALKYSDNDAKVQVNLRAQNNNLIIECIDNGPGIRPDKRQAIYQAHTRLSQQNSSTPGLGLGLTIVKFIVDTYNGEIEIEDNKPKGTRFTVTLKGIVTSER